MAIKDRVFSQSIGVDMGGNTIPMAFNHVGEFLIGFDPLLLKRRPPIIALAVPRLSD
jgi:hypothetical protein